MVEPALTIIGFCVISYGQLEHPAMHIFQYYKANPSVHNCNNFFVKEEACCDSPLAKMLR
jgi:hypothetical protein